MKSRHQTMVIHGRTEPADPASHVVIFRSCLGDVGNVLNKMLENRKTSQKDLFLQCDHSSANKPTNQDVLKHFNISLAGCLAHSRRMFKKHEKQDPERCQEVLTMMFLVTHHENLLKNKGRNRENTLSLRRSWSALALETIYFFLQQTLQGSTWSDQTPLGKAARHFIKHFEKLTVFLRQPELEATNNSSERLLRPEKLSQGSSYFRDTLEGRARFDILRSLSQTCISAGIPFSKYLLYLLTSSQEDLASNPKEYTPQAVKQRLQEKPERAETINQILARGF